VCNTIQKCDFRVSTILQIVKKHKLLGLAIVKRLLIAYVIGNISAKKMSKSIHVRHSYSKPKVHGTFF